MFLKKYKDRILLVLLLATGAGYFLIKKKNNKKAEAPPEIEIPVAAVSKLKTLNVTSVFFTDMEEPDQQMWLGEKSSEKKYSGNFCNKLSDKTEYGITFIKKGIEIPEYKKIKQARISFQLFCDQPLKKARFVYAVTGAPDKMFEYFFLKNMALFQILIDKFLFPIFYLSLTNQIPFHRYL